MLFAKVALALPLDTCFDYSIPKELQSDIKSGSRVLVNFRNKKLIGYVSAIAKTSAIKKVKPISSLIDKEPVLSKEMLILAEKIAGYYCCSLGEAIETMSPPEVRRGKPVKEGTLFQTIIQNKEASLERGLRVEAWHDLEPAKRWQAYLDEIKKVQAEGKSVIILLSDIHSVLKAKGIFEKDIKEIRLLYRKEKEEFLIWQNIRSKEQCIVLGTRSAIFAPVNNLGLIIMDHEEDSVYKQEQVPHYHARTVALMRAEIEGAGVILESISPSLENFYLIQKEKIKYRKIDRQKPYPEIKIIDKKRMPYAERKVRAIFPRAVTDAISSVLSEKGKVLVFINRKGFATFAACHNCGKALKCPACNVSLIYHFDQEILRCHHCAFKMAPPEICPNCNAGYIKYSGLGTDKVESELARIFPQARMGEDMVVSTSAVLKEEGRNFDLICVLNIDNALNRVDYLAAEKVFYLLSGLVTLTEKKIIISTVFPNHHCFRSLVKADPQVFYNQELKFRKQLKYPPFRNMALVKLRGRNEDKVKNAAEALFEKLKDGGKDIQVLSINPADPPKLRGNFYWQVLLNAKDAPRLSKFLKKHLKDFRYSGIIVTVDIDPI